jgi:hypothetical protein
VSTIAVARPRSRRAVVLRRVGVVLAVLQAVGSIALALSDFGSGFGAVVAAVMIGCGALVLALTVPVWRGIGWAAVVVAVATLLSSLTGVPAFFIPGLPAAAVISASVGIVLAVVTAVLLLVRPRA